MKYLVTGFEPFAGDSYNPTKAAIEVLVASWSGPEELVAEVMPVEFERAQQRIRFLIEEEKPDLVLCCGLNAKIDTPELERIAHNCMNASIADNAGYRPEEVLIEEDGPEFLRSTLPVDHVVSSLNEQGVALRPSDDAGRYVCNATLYRALWSTRKSTTLAAFLHIPSDAEGTRAADDAALIVRILRAAA